MDLESLIFNYEKRQAMRNHPAFFKIKDIWNNGLYDTAQKTGCLNYLMKQVHENKALENPNAIVKQYEWIQFYFDSGKKRKQLEQTYQTEKYYGRTLEELYDLALEFREEVNNAGLQININEQAALNIVYIKVIDDTFNEYMRCFNIIFKMKKVYPDFDFFISQPLESIEYGVDVIIKSGNTPVAALKILPRSEIKRKEEVESSFKQKHATFKMIYDIDTFFVYSSVQGYIQGELPKL